tara:strand:+ start:51 stop:200 length:150 start_codon:yes stop_codon:yes gene_type:complete
VECGYVQPITFNGKSRDPEFETYSSGREFFSIPQLEMDNNFGKIKNSGY